MPDSASAADIAAPSRETLLHSLYEAAELEHNLMCTYLYAAFSLKGAGDGLSAPETAAVEAWRRTIIEVAIEETGHLVAVWNITSGLGGAPRIGRMNFPLDIGYLPAGLVVKLAPFNQATLQHFIHLERPVGSAEPDGPNYSVERQFTRSVSVPRLTPMGRDYETVGEFYAELSNDLRRFVGAHGESVAFCGDPALQLSASEVDLGGAQRVICLKTALQAFDAIVAQGEGAPGEAETSHFAKFTAIREEYRALLAANPSFAPAHPAATNPVLRPPPRPEGRVWIESPEAAAVVDLANASYGLMLRLLSYAYSIPSSSEKSLAVDIGVGIMRAVTYLGERASRMPAGPSHPECNAGMSFTTLRDTAPLPAQSSAWRFYTERLDAFSKAAAMLAQDGDGRTKQVARVLSDLAQRAAAGQELRQLSETLSTPTKPATASSAQPSAQTSAQPPQRIVDGIEFVEGEALTLIFEAKRCIHARFCVTGAPEVFLANVQGPWLHPDAMDAERLTEIAHACPSGAIQYARKDGRPDEPKPPVNLVGVREAGRMRSVGTW